MGYFQAGIVLNDSLGLLTIVQSVSGFKCIALPVLCHANVTFALGDIEVFGTGREDRNAVAYV